ncbi:unnamed protein product [Effrenium voratum]|nr:unnamed protein product [Effrenium voratum]
MLGPSVFGDLSTFAMVVWATGVPLVIMTVLEVGVRTAAQAGPLWRFRTWQKMMIPLYHQLEAFVLALAAYRGGMSVYLLVVAVAGQNMATNVSDADKATVLVLLGYRALRNWGDWHEVSVQTTLRLRRKRSKSNKPWMDEYNRQLANNSERFFVRMQRCIDTRASQLVLFSAAAAWRFGAAGRIGNFSRQVLGYVLLVAICLEFLARAKAQDVDSFLRVSLKEITRDGL